MRRFWLGAVCGIAFGTLLFTADEALKSRPLTTFHSSSGGGTSGDIRELAARRVCANVAGGVLCMHGDITEAVFTLEPHATPGSGGGRFSRPPRRRS